MLRAGDNDLIEEPLVTATGCSMTDEVGEFRDISRHYCGTGGGGTDEGDAADSGGNGRHFLPEPCRQRRVCRSLSEAAACQLWRSVLPIAI
jgi:hypothetical protein